MSLRRTLQSLSQMRMPPNLDWELLIVDNGSTDSTSQIVEEFAGSLPIRRIVESTPGLSNARNCGVAAALGDYILWTDDDVIADPGWLEAYCQAFEAFPDGAVFGGRIIPVLEKPSPAWFTENTDLLEWVIAARDFGDEYLPLSVPAHRLPFGANYAVRGSEQRRFAYDPMLGVSPGKRRMGEESTVIRAILNAGAAGYWVPGAKVDHILTAARQSVSYIRDYFRGHGETFAHLAHSSGEQSRARLLLNYGSRVFANGVLFYGLKPVLPPRLWLPRLKNLGYGLGVVDYALKDHADER